MILYQNKFYLSDSDDDAYHLLRRIKNGTKKPRKTRRKPKRVYPSDSLSDGFDYDIYRERFYVPDSSCDEDDQQVEFLEETVEHNGPLSLLCLDVLSHIIQYLGEREVNIIKHLSGPIYYKFLSGEYVQRYPVNINKISECNRSITSAVYSSYSVFKVGVFVPNITELTLDIRYNTIGYSSRDDITFDLSSCKRLRNVTINWNSERVCKTKITHEANKTLVTLTLNSWTEKIVGDDLYGHEVWEDVPWYPDEVITLINENMLNVSVNDHTERVYDEYLYWSDSD